MTMNWRLEPCTTGYTQQVTTLVDRLSSLPDELLIRILSLLPTKDVAATCVLSPKLKCVLPWIPNLDFDASPISYCWKHPHAIERFPSFVAFVDNVLSAYKPRYLNRFRLRLGMDIKTKYLRGCKSDGQYEFGCNQNCLPVLKSTHLIAWISFPLALSGLRELELCILVREPDDAQLPPAIFMCQTLEVLKLDSNLGLDQVSNMPSYRLPNLKLLRLCLAPIIPNDIFLPKLVSSCPLLEDLTVHVFTNYVNSLSISSPSLRRLTLFMSKGPRFEFSNSEIVVIHTPNLEYLYYNDNLSLKYNIPIMPCLKEAAVVIRNDIETEPHGMSFLNLLRLIRSVAYAQHLFLSYIFATDLNYDPVKGLLPLFPNLKHLTLENGEHWDKFLMAFLNKSPVLETLVFTSLGTPNDNVGDSRKRNNLELEFFRSTQAIPSCLRYQLKRIVVENYYGYEREIEIIRFLLRHALILEELVICRSPRTPYPYPYQAPDQMLTENLLKNLPRESITCSIQVS